MELLGGGSRNGEALQGQKNRMMRNIKLKCSFTFSEQKSSFIYLLLLFNTECKRQKSKESSGKNWQGQWLGNIRFTNNWNRQLSMPNRVLISSGSNRWLNQDINKYGKKSKQLQLVTGGSTTIWGEDILSSALMLQRCELVWSSLVGFLLDNSKRRPSPFFGFFLVEYRWNVSLIPLTIILKNIGSLARDWPGKLAFVVKPP